LSPIQIASKSFNFQKTDIQKINKETKKEKLIFKSRIIKELKRKKSYFPTQDLKSINNFREKINKSIANEKCISKKTVNLLLRNLLCKII